MISIIPSQKSVNDIRLISHDTFLTLVRNPPISINSVDDIASAKSNSGYFYGCSFRESYVKKENVLEYNYLIVDYDDADFKNKLSYLAFEKINFIAYTSINNKYKNNNSDRFRIIFQFNRAISKDEWADYSSKINGVCKFQKSLITSFCDPSTFTSNRGFCIPVSTPFYKYAIFNNGRNISLDDFDKEGIVDKANRS